jgi:hypothetical protein
MAKTSLVVFFKKPYLPSCLLACISLAYAGLLPRSRWQGDEYLDFAVFREQGWRLIEYRLLHWSPRPVAELLLGLYATAVNGLHRPLAASCDALLWAGLMAACVVPAWFGAPRPPRLFLGLAFFCLFLLGHGVSEVFFWPAGGVAYLPTLAGAVWLFWSVADRRRAAAACALVLAAWSSEMGMLLVLAFCLCAGLARFRAGWPGLWWLLPGAIAAGLAAILLAGGRVAAATISTESATQHHPWASLIAAVPASGAELLAIGHQSLAAKLAILIGFRWSALAWRRPPGQGVELAALGVALLGAAFISVAAAFFQFGDLCCERHETMRECYLVLAMAAFGAASASFWPRPAPAPWCVKLPVLAICLSLFVASLPQIAAAYRLVPQAIRARAATWHSGMSAGTQDMVLTLGPVGGLIGNGEFLAPGTIAQRKGAPWYIDGVLQFFGKTRLTVVPISPPISPPVSPPLSPPLSP